ncbi:MAG TPA: hypothetical protein VFL92_00045, partial [Sphingomonas sp.]|nr:hypothetical protein [Sphingomonas sp.]
MSGASAAAQPFNPRVVLLIVAAALIAFIAFLALAAYAPDFRSGRNGQAHALSVSGDGYAGLVQLTRDVGAYPLLVRDEAGLATQDLLIVTPPPMGDPDALDRLLSFRGNAPTLIVLPKWATVPMPGRSGWVQAIGAVGTGASALSKIAPHLGLVTGTDLPPASRLPKGVPRLARARIGRQALQQRLSGSGFTPVLLDANGRVVIAAIPNLP